MNRFFKVYSKYIILAALAYMPLFGHLDNLPIRAWDEARLAINAYEMHRNGNMIVTYFDGQPEDWNTKPPLMIWLQVFFMKIIGVNELAIRLPSALAALGTCLTILLFSIQYLKKFWFGFIAVMFLITSQAYIHIHSTRTGDYDALLTLFTTLSGIYFFLFYETKRPKQLYLFFVFTTLAVLTKSITGLLFIPALVVYSILRNQFIPLLKNRHFYYGLLSFCVVVFGYYLLREFYQPGYISLVQQNELGGRYLNVLENHEHPFWYYYSKFIGSNLFPWPLLLPCGLILGLVIRNVRMRRLTLFASIMILTFFLIISFSKTKLEWYDVPLFPFLSLLAAVFVNYIFEFFKNLKRANQTLTNNILPFIFLFLVFITPYQKIINKTYLPKEQAHDKDAYEIGYYLKEALRKKHYLNGAYLLYDGYYAQNQFYVHILNDRGVRIDFKDYDKLEDGDVVIASQSNIKQYIEANYSSEVIKTNGNIVTYKIHGRKQ